MSKSGKCRDNLNFRTHYGAAEKTEAKVQELLRKIKKGLGALEKNHEKNQELLRKVKAICTGFSVLASQSVKFSFGGKTKIQMLTTSCRIVTLVIHGLFKSFGLYNEYVSTVLERVKKCYSGTEGSRLMRISRVFIIWK